MQRADRRDTNKQGRLLAQAVVRCKADSCISMHDHERGNLATRFAGGEVRVGGQLCAPSCMLMGVQTGDRW